jgi:hypothetical protein
MKNTASLSANAKKLYQHLCECGHLHEMTAASLLFNQPEFIRGQTENKYWQWTVNSSFFERSYCINEVFVDFKKTIEKSFRSQTSDAYLELKDAGLAEESNNGYNSYTYYVIR